MTKREFLEKVIATGNEDIATYAQEAITKLDKANATRAAKPSKKALENAPLIAKIVDEILSDEPVTATDIAAALEVSTQKASALALQAVKAGKAIKGETKVKGKGTVKTYVKA